MRQSAKRHHSKKRIDRWLRLIAFAVMLPAAAAAAQAAAGCDARSGAHRVALLELYTSEGCNSCPPADRFLSSLAKHGFHDGRIAALAFHVDYWDALGWPDRFAQPAFSARQRLAADRAGARLVYTPQLLLDGRDLAQGWRGDNFADKVASINREAASAALGVSQRLRADSLEVTVSVSVVPASAAQLFVAVVESGLSSAVRAGENAGRTLQHDQVVRLLEGPFPAESRSAVIRLPVQWNRTRLALIAFLQEPASGKVLQALAAPLCPGD
jgi:hypothetical protein